jgi:hypothetical protein
VTEDELRAAGWPEDEIPGYLAGRAEAEAAIAAIDTEMTARRTAAPAELQLSPAEQRAASLVAELAAQSDGLDRLATARRRAAAESQVTVVPDDGKPSMEQIREWALREALQHPAPIIVPGEEPLHDWVLQTPVGVPVNPGAAGQIMITERGPEVASPPLLPDHLPPVMATVKAPRPPVLEVLTPGNAGQMERRWAVRERLLQNRILAAKWGVERCLAEGAFTPDDAMSVKGVKPVELPPGLEGM